MKILKSVFTLLIIACIATFIGCGGGSGGGSDEPSGTVKFNISKFTQDKNKYKLSLVIRANTKVETMEVASPKGYSVSTKDDQTFTITGPAIPNPTQGNIQQVFTLSFYLNGVKKTQKITVNVEPNDIKSEVKVVVVAPAVKYGSAYDLKYSSSNHLISVKVTLTKDLESKKLVYEWVADTENGKVIANTDKAYDKAELIYRPKDTTSIPADVTTGANREYNRGYKINSDFLHRYIYLKVKDQNGNVYATEEFYVDEPVTPPAPTK